MSTPWPVRPRTQPFFDRITVIGSSTTVRSMVARSSALIRVRRSSPNVFASFSSSLTTSFFSTFSSPRISFRAFLSASSALRSSLSLMPSSRVSCPRRRLTMSSAWRSVNLYFSFSLRFASAWSSQARISLMISSIFTNASRRPMTMSQPLRAPRQAVLGAAAHRVQAELAPFAQDVDDVLGLGQAVQPQPGQVERVARLEAGLHQQRLHGLLGALARGARLDHQAQLGLAVGLVAHGLDLLQHELLQAALLLRHLLLAGGGLRIDQRLDLLQHLAAGHAVRQLGDDDAPLAARELFRGPARAQRDRAAAGLVGGADLVLRAR